MKNFSDILLREQIEHQIFIELNHFIELKPSMEIILKYIKLLSRCDALGIRLKDNSDFPFLVYDGFSTEFIEKENFLRGTDPMMPLECVCGSVLMGNTRQDFPFFTKNGSFFTNNTSALVQTLCEADRRNLQIRGTCNKEGYQSIVIVPLRYNGSIIGTIQLNHKEPNKFNDEAIAYIEMLGVQIGTAVWNRIEYARLKKENEQLKKELLSCH